MIWQCKNMASTFLRIAFTLGLTFMLTSCVNSQLKALPDEHMWHTERMISPVDKSASCHLFSSARPFSSGAGLDHVRIVIHRNGLVSLRSSRDVFDTSIRNQIGIRVDDHAPKLAPSNSSNAKELTYSAPDSMQLLDQLKTGRIARIQVVLAPRKELLATTFALDSFPDALQEYRVCEVIREEQAAAVSQRPYAHN